MTEPGGDWAVAREGSVDIEVLVVPRSSRSKVAGIHEGRLKVQITAPPVDGEANAALIELVAKSLGVKKAAIQIVSGETGRRKRLRIEGVALDAVRALAP